MSARLAAASVALAASLAAFPTRALDKQGAAHGSEIGGGDDGFDLSGALTVGVSLYNPSYAARPDNTGLTLMRYAVHADVDLVGRKLSIPLDVNVFTDRNRKGAAVFSPTELDGIAGLTTTWDAGPGALEFGSRVEHDTDVSRATPSEVVAARSNASPACAEGGLCSQTYVDARARYLYSLTKLAPAIGDALSDGDVSGWVTIGWFAYNPTYAARPDNTGIALLRYALHTEVSMWSDLVSIGADATMFTPRNDHPLRPSELDFTPEIIVHEGAWEAHLAYERDMPLDEKHGLVQSFVFLLGVFNWDIHGATSRPLEDHEKIPSP